MPNIPVNTLRPSKAPNLPIGPTAYAQTYQDQFNNALRLYFNEVDNISASLSGTAGGKFLRFPYAAVQRTTDFNFATADTATLITCDQEDYLNTTTLDNTDGIHVTVPGIYNYQYSIQFANTHTQAHNAYLWLRKNGADLAGTGSKFDVPSTHGASDGYLIAACNFYVELNADDYVELWGAAARVDNGVTDGVYIEAYAAQVSPFAMPAIPSVVITLSFVSGLPT